jgi:signal peptidase I
MAKQNLNKKKNKRKLPPPNSVNKETTDIKESIINFLKKIFFGKKAIEENKTSYKDFIKEICILLGIFLVLNSFVLASFEVPTGSMEDTVMTGDFLFVNKFLYGGTSPRTIPFTGIRIPWFRIPGFREVKRYDVIVFEFPGNREEVNPDFVYYLKRCVGLPGDTVEIRNKVLYTNGIQQPLPKYLKFENLYTTPSGIKNDYIFPPLANFNEDNYGPIVVPKVGDTIELNDANYYIDWKIFIEREGHKTNLLGNVVTIDDKPVSKYIVERDYYFGIGDNRDNSLDSRFWGFIPKENIVGTPMIVYWSWNPNIPLYDVFNKLSSVKLGRIFTIIR